MPVCGYTQAVCMCCLYCSNAVALRRADQRLSCAALDCCAGFQHNTGSFFVCRAAEHRSRWQLHLLADSSRVLHNSMCCMAASMPGWLACDWRCVNYLWVRIRDGAWSGRVFAGFGQLHGPPGSLKCVELECWAGGTFCRYRQCTESTAQLAAGC